MSYFDDASLAFLASGAAGKDGKAYSIKPVPVYGPELVTNGDFATDSDWTKGTGTTISGGTANFSNANGVSLYQNIGTQSGNVHVTFSVTNYTSGTLNVYSGGNESVSTINVAANSVGIYSANINRSGGNANIIFGSSDNFTGSIDNVSFKEVIVSDGDFTFTRGSNLSATRVNSSQLIEKGRENLLLQSNSFDTNWIGSAAIATSGQSGYDGTNDAWLLTKTADTYANIRQDITFSGVHTFSVYLKQGTNTSAILRTTGGTAAKVEINLIDGTTSGTSNDISVKTESIGNNWWRCSLTLNASSDTAVRIYPEAPLGGANAGNIYIQDAQLESSLVATDVIETTTTTGKAGILEDTPRFDYSGGATCPSLLLEPSRSNLLPQSEYFNTWTALLNVTLSPNATTSPEGLLNATKLVEDSATAIHRIYQIVSITSGQAYTQSVFAKEGERRYLQIAFGSKISGTDYANFDLQIGEVSLEVGSINATIEPYGNGWYRCSATSTANVTSSEAFYYTIVESGSASRFASYSGDGTSGAYIFGAQVEAGSYPTSYIPTYSVSATRAKDVCSKTNASGIIGQTEGTLFAEIQGYANALSGNSFLSLTESTGNNRLLIGQSSSINQLRVFIDVGTLANGFNYSVTDITQPQKIAIVYSNSGNTIAIYVNGVKETGYVVGDTFNALLTDIVFNNGANGQYAEFNVNELQVYKEALTDAEAITLTTI